MSWIIRLQNLPWSANSMDVRMFFGGLSIPDGGVHIVGGELGDAFIAFSTDEDARQAMTLDGCKLKETGVRLLLSSRAEMQKVIETARQQTVSVFQLNSAATVAPAQVPPPIIANIANPQLLLAQQLLAAQQQQQLPFNNHHNMAAAVAMTSIPPPAMAPKLDLVGQQAQQQHVPAQIIDRNRQSGDKKILPRDRRRDSRSRSRERHSRVRSRSRDRSTSRDRSRRNRSRSRSRDRTYRRRREKRSYSRDHEYDSDDSDSRGSKRKSVTPPKGNKDSIQIWENQAPINFRSIYNNSSNSSNGNSNDNGNGMTRPNANNNRPSAPDPPSIDKNSFAAFQRLRERRNESAFQAPKVVAEEKNDTPIDLTEDDHNCCVMVSNVEKATGYGELRRFFQGLPVRQNGLKMINNNLGKRTGVAYVRFHRPESRKFALMRSGQMLNGNKLTVVQMGDNEFEEAIDNYRPPVGPTCQLNHLKPSIINPQPPGMAQPLAFDQIVFTCLKVTDVPSLTTEQDIMKVFGDYGLMHIIIAKDKHKRNCAFLKLNRPEDAKRALTEKSHFTMGGHKSVIVTMCSEAVFDEVMNSTVIEETSGYGSQDDVVPQQAEDSADDKAQPVTNKTETKATKQEKRSAGSRWGEKVVAVEEPKPVTIPMDTGKPLAGPWANNEQSNPPTALNPILSQLNLALPFLSSLLPQAAAALGKTDIPRQQQQPQQQMQLLQQQQPVTVSRDPRLKNMNLNNNGNGPSAPNAFASARLPDPRNNMNPRGGGGFSMSSNRQGESDCVVISNLEPSCSDLDVASFFSKAGIVPVRVHILLNTAGLPSGDAFVEFSNSKDAHSALLQNERMLGKNHVFVETIPREQVEEVLASFGVGRDAKAAAQPPQSIYNQFVATGINPALMHGANPRMPMQRPQAMPPRGMGGGGPPGNIETNVLSLNNVPYRAGVEDIIDFFSGYDIRPQDVMRRFNDAGQATAEAKVRFKNPAEASKAYEEKKFGKMSGRTIYLEFDH